MVKKSVLLTRPVSGNSDLAQKLENKGLQLYVEPIFTVDFLHPKINLDNIQAVIITSANAASCVIENKIPLTVKIFAIGRKSAKKLLAQGYKNIFYPKKPAAQSLLETVVQNCLIADGKIVYFCGDAITLDFKKTLEPHGFKVEKFLAYKIKWNNEFSADFLQKTKEKSFDYLTFYSINSARNFYRLAKNHNLLEYFSTSILLSFSEKIADELRDLGFKNEIKIFNDNFTCLK